ncbi:MarR family winged helix-turn-helix transcriptional regulator [Oenococcus alcoholitolerans]|uniref:MarR family winged helix-turn-helix transcriptional regulator n=1 Tax=Oenococcus alcoholitolerans TaxID=931074 RepID=UPI003F72B392
MTALEILRQTDNIYIEKVTSIMKRFGMTYAEHRLLILVEEGFSTQEGISKKTNLDTSTLSRQLKSAVKKGFLKRTPTGKDKRQLVYFLTESGKNKNNAVAAELARLDHLIFSDWNRNDRALLNELLIKLKESF